MPVGYLRRLTSPERTARADRHLGLSLAFVAGATNAGGFLAVGRYTSHMTGVVSTMADDLALGNVRPAVDALFGLIAFVVGATVSSVLVQWARARRMRSEFALPLMCEATLLLVFGLMGATLQTRSAGIVDITVVLLCFMMGLQNAIITKISHAVIRTTHVTGLVTDIGIEVGRVVFWRLTRVNVADVGEAENRQRLFTHVGLVLFFFVGGLAGAMGFNTLGFVSAVPLALFLVVLAVVPLVDDLRHRLLDHPI